jgi:predicted O-methyltransferase YrrM
MYSFTEDWFSENSGEPVVRQFQHFLSSYVNKPCKFLEVGSYEGMSALWMLDNILTHEDARLWCIDAWAGRTGDAFNTFVDNLSLSGHKDKVEIIKGESSDRLGRLKRDFFDFIYIDGNHEEKAVIGDAIMSFRLLTKGGIMAFDDYLMGIRHPLKRIMLTGLPKNAIDYFLRLFSDELVVIHSDYQLWIRKL